MMPYQEETFDEQNNINNNININNNNNNNCNNNNNNSTNQNIMANINQNSQSPQLPPPSTAGMTKAEIRKSNKPIMEKKRRARINHCLNELKTLILEAMRKDPARHTKLEKADILEMTVKHLQTIQRQQLVMAVSTDPTVVHKFKSGFIDCAEEVNRYISQIEGLDQPVKQRLMNHLNNCVTGLQQLSPFNFGTGFGTTAATAPITQIHHPTSIPLPQDVNNNGRIQMGGVQFIPSRLPSGELALVMPNSSSLPFFPTANLAQPPTIDINPAYPRLSAFNTVQKQRIHGTSPPLSPISSISSMGDDSSPPSEFTQIATTPPLQLTSHMMSAFPTPPSGGSIKSLTIPASLQQPHISSTTETPKSTLASVINQPNLQQFVNKKRPYPVDLGCEIQQPESKYIKMESTDVKPMTINNNNNSINDNHLNNNLNNNLQNYHHHIHQAPSPNGEMWRPW